jgi:peptidoglycan hydrolase CwlO-like protein
MASKKLTKHQKELQKKFGSFRKKQAAQRARFAEIRNEIKAALAKFEAASDELSDAKLRREKIRLLSLAKRVVTKVG